MNWRHFHTPFSQRWNCDEIQKNKDANQKLKRLKRSQLATLASSGKLVKTEIRPVSRGTWSTSRSPIPRATRAWSGYAGSFLCSAKAWPQATYIRNKVIDGGGWRDHQWEVSRLYFRLYFIDKCRERYRVDWTVLKLFRLTKDLDGGERLSQSAT